MARRRTVGKLEMARLLGWSAPKLDRELRNDHNFPVISPGGKGVEWQFDAAAVLTFVRMQEGPTQAGLPGLPLSPTQRKNEASAKLLEMQLERQLGEMVPRAEVLAVAGAAFQRLGKALETLPSQVGREFNWSPQHIAEVRARIDEFRNNFARDLQEYVEVVDTETADREPKRT